jgi:hypothetical protein
MEEGKCNVIVMMLFQYAETYVFTAILRYVPRRTETSSVTILYNVYLC